MLKANLALLPLSLMAVFALLASPVAWAEGTPDGETPENEAVSDDLIGFTPGMYGRCVASFEAQDYDADPSTEEPFESFTLSRSGTHWECDGVRHLI